MRVAMLLAPLLLVSCQTAKPEPKPMFAGWEDATVLQMHQNCLVSTAEVGMPKPQSGAFCNCMVGTLATNGTSQDWEALSLQDKRTVATAIGDMCLEAVFGEDTTSI
jgi:hypothetical protein